MPRTGNKWDQRIERARELAKAHPFSAEILSFYCKLTAFQKTSYLQFQSDSGSQDLRHGSRPPLDDAELELLLARWSPFLSLIAREAPTSLAEFARGLSSRGRSGAIALVRSGWPDPPAGTQIGDRQSSQKDPSVQPPEHDPCERFCAHAFLQPYAEFLADRADVSAPLFRRPVCPYCGSPPLAGVLRPEGDGAKRSLVCSFCRTEWDYLRIACPACEEGREDRLCVYSTPAVAGVRVEACDTCGAYIKTIDLTLNGLAIPEVDELAAVPLTLWAEERGYRKVARNVIGL